MLTNQQPVGDLKAKFAAASLKNAHNQKQPLLFDGVSQQSQSSYKFEGKESRVF
jgi:hypothetical protein